MWYLISTAEILWLPDRTNLAKPSRQISPLFSTGQIKCAIMSIYVGFQNSVVTFADDGASDGTRIGNLSQSDVSTIVGLTIVRHFFRSSLRSASLKAC